MLSFVFLPYRPPTFWRPRFIKGGALTRHFNPKEFVCPCCGIVKINPHLFAVLEFIRLYFKKPVYITSGYRCELYNKRVGGRLKSKHLLGDACDIYIEGIAPEQIYDLLNLTFPKTYGIGLYETFVHVDVRPNRARWMED